MMLIYIFRNYHVFYYLLAGADEDERESLHLLEPQDYYYLRQVSILYYYYPLANEVAKGYSNATVRPSVTSL